MGEDAIYFVRKSTPRLFVSLALVFLCIFAIVLGFHWIVKSSWLFVLFLVLFGLVFTQLALEYRRSKSLVRGNVEDLPISDLTKAISWLSLFSEGKRMFGGPGGDAWINVDKVADHIGGEFKTKWLSIIQSHKMPMRERNAVIAIFSVFTPLFAMIFVAGWVKDRFVQVIALGTLFMGTMVMIYLLSKKLRTDSDLYESEEAMTIAGDMVRQLIPWVSARTTRPIKVVLANGKYEHVRAVDSIWGNTIACIEPRTTSFGHEESRALQLEDQEGTSFLASQRNWNIATVMAHVSVGFITVFMLVLALQKILVGTADDLDRGYFGMFVVLVPLGQFLVYVLMPMMKMFFTGGKVSASDIHIMLKRTPKSLLPSIRTPDFDEKMDFLMTLNNRRYVKISELEDSIKLWLRDEEHRPSKKRYFVVEGNTVSLTPKGEDLVRLVKDKIPEDTVP